MKTAPYSRRTFLGQSLRAGLIAGPACELFTRTLLAHPPREIKADLVVVGGSLGGCAAVYAALQQGMQVIWTEETQWIGGQLTSQGVPPDEHAWIESFGRTASYAKLRRDIRDYYRRHYPLKTGVRNQWNLNPGSGSVSRLCHEPKVALAVLQNWFAPFLSRGQLNLLLRHVPIAADTQNDRVEQVTVRSLESGSTTDIHAPYFLDATEMGDLLPLTQTEWVCGFESKKETGEFHAPEESQPENHQAFTVCFAIDYQKGEDHTLPRPESYDFWSNYTPKLAPPWPGKWLSWTYTHPRSGEPRQLGFNPENGPFQGVVNLWKYRRILAAENFEPGWFSSDVSLVNWPQNDYLESPLIGVTEAEKNASIQSAKQLSLSLLYWMQTEAPRHDGGSGYAGLRLRPDIMGTEDGLAMYPYIRESRRIRARTIITEADCGLEQRMAETGEDPTTVKARNYSDSIGIGSYPIDLHPSTGGDNYIDFPSLPFQIPLGSLLPVRMQNLIPACKNIGTTHITNGCYRLHPVEWNIGESAGLLASFAIQRKTIPSHIHENQTLLNDFQRWIQNQGVEIKWPNGPF